MKFFIKVKNKTEQRVLTYLPEDHSFYMEPTTDEIDFNIEINYLNLRVVDKRVIDIDGYCPANSWIKSDYKTPNYIKGDLLIKDDLEPGFTYKINKENEWKTYVNTKTGWICIGDMEKIGKTVEFINNCLAVIDDSGELISLWLKPQVLPDL